MKALIKVGYGCNENCTFCHTLVYRDVDDTAERIDAKIDRAKKLGYSMVVLSGGEPTIRPELFRWATRVAGHGLDFGLVTNGLVLSYPDVVERLLALRLRYVYMSLHGGTRKVHRSVVRADTFDRALEAVANVHGRVPELTVNCVVTTANVDALRGVVDALAGFPELTLKFSMTQPKGGGEKAFDVIVPDVERCAASIHDAIGYGLEKRGEGRGPRFGHDGVPLCLLPGYEDLYDDLRTNDFASMIEVSENDFFPVDDVAKVQTEVCVGCSLRGPCAGLFRGYLEAHGDGALRPVVDRPRASAYAFEPAKDVRRPEGAPCPVFWDGTIPYDRARSLFVRLRDRMRLYETETRAFSDEELAEKKLREGLVFVDLTTKAFPDDPGRDLRRLALVDECVACAKREACTGCWAPVPGDAFGADVAMIRERLASLSGRVGVLGASAAQLDAALRARAAAGAIEAVTIEPGAAPSAPLDHLVALGSLSATIEPRLALEPALASLRPGGTLFVADERAIGLVRSRPLGAPAERRPRYRDDGAAEVARHVADAPLRLIERRDAGHGASSWFWLRWEKLPS